MIKYAILGIFLLQFGDAGWLSWFLLVLAGLYVILKWQDIERRVVEFNSYLHSHLNLHRKGNAYCLSCQEKKERHDKDYICKLCRTAIMATRGLITNDDPD
jgi:hypothetical protein